MSTIDARGRGRGVVLMLAAVLVVVGSVAASRTTTSRELEPPAQQPVALATSGTAYCPVTAAEGEGAALLLSAVGAADAEVRITRFTGDVGVAEEPRLLPAGTTAVLPVPAEQLQQPLTVDWRGGPTVAQYQLADPDELLTASCVDAPSLRWHLSGFDTSLGSVSLLHLFNPFSQDALVSLQFGTPEGRVELVIADELLIPAGGSTVLNLAQFRPETRDLAVTVTARAGRVIPQGQIDLAPPAENVEGVTGRALVPAVPEVSEVVLLPEAMVDATSQSWITVYNPGDRAAAVQLQVSTPLGDASALASELTIPAGGTARIELAGLSALPQFGVRIASVNGVGVTATRVSAITDVGRTGVAVMVAASATATGWAVPGGLGPDASITLYNPNPEVAVADVEVAGGRPETWTAVSVPPNGLTVLPLSQATPEGPALVQADIPLVAGVVNLRPESATAYWSATGVATEAVVGGGTALPVQRDPGLSSVPAISATATPTPLPVQAEPGAEGGLGEAAPTSEPSPGETTTAPTIDPPVLGTPTTQPPAASPAPDSQSDAPASQPTPNAAPTQDPGSGPSPLPPAATEEGSLFGKQRRGWRRGRPPRSVP